MRSHILSLRLLVGWVMMGFFKASSSFVVTPRATARGAPAALPQTRRLAKMTPNEIIYLGESIRDGLFGIGSKSPDLLVNAADRLVSGRDRPVPDSDEVSSKISQAPDDVSTEVGKASSDEVSAPGVGKASSDEVSALDFGKASDEASVSAPGVGKASSDEVSVSAPGVGKASSDEVSSGVGKASSNHVSSGVGRASSGVGKASRRPKDRFPFGIASISLAWVISTILAVYKPEVQSFWAEYPAWFRIFTARASVVVLAWSLIVGWTMTMLWMTEYLLKSIRETIGVFGIGKTRYANDDN